MATTTVRGKGGVEVGGAADVAFRHGSGAALSQVVLEIDWDGDGDFDQAVENVTGDFVEGESMTGRDWPSQLTGKAGPGQARFTLRNDDDRYNYFNAESPLNEAPFSLATGRKIRVRTADAPNPDPALLAKDRFFGEGQLDGTDSDELGNPWTRQTTGRFTRQTDSSGDTLAVPELVGRTHIATVDVGTADCYAQIRFKFVDGPGGQNFAGLVYRFTDIDNYGVVAVTGSALLLGDRVAGVTTTVAQIPIEARRDVTVGAHVDGGVVTVYLDGVPMIVDDAQATSATEVGIYSFWAFQRPPSLHEMYVWDGLPAETEGVIWTGDVTSIKPKAPVDGNKTVEVTAEGWLSKAAETDVRPPASIGAHTLSEGVTSGLMVGATLAEARLLHPPGPINEGTFRLGAVGLPDGKALDVARQFEEVELGFLHETNEGPIGFDDRAARASAPVAAVWADHQEAQFRYRNLDLLDWRREIVNRVEARLSPRVTAISSAVISTGSSAVGVQEDVQVVLPDQPDAAVGNLIVVVIASTIGASGVNWLTPAGWTAFRDAGADIGKIRIYAKVAETSDLGATVTFYEDTADAGGAYVAYAFTVTDWYGNIQQGVTVGDITSFGPPSTVPQAAAGQNNPPTVFPSWGPAPSLFFVFRAGMTSLTGATVAAASEANCPDGYKLMNSTFVNGATNGSDVALQEALRFGCVTVEQPSPFATGEGIFEGFVAVEAVTIAVRGFAGDPPETHGGQVVRVDDFASQDRVNGILTHTNPAELFADVDDATDYANVVLGTFADDRPIFRLSFVASTNEAYRGQAIRRRVGHKIRLAADRTTGMGVDGPFFIESIRHRWADGGAWWETDWELSPA